MPASILAQLVVELIAEVGVHLFAAGAGKAVDSTKAAIEEAKERRRQRALASADLMVLAAYHDAVVTEAERRVLARSCAKVLAKVDDALDADALIERWGQELGTEMSDAEFEALLRERAEPLESRDAKQVLRGVRRLVAADAPGKLGFRERAPTSSRDTLGLFEALLADR